MLVLVLGVVSVQAQEHGRGGWSHSERHGGSGHYDSRGCWIPFAVGAVAGMFIESAIETRPTYYVQPQQVVVQPAPQQVVVEKPVVVVQSQRVEAFPFHIPTKNGGYMTIMLSQVSNGYIGPQGELYTQFPSVAILRAQYDK